jgi:hypothetical protein
LVGDGKEKLEDQSLLSGFEANRGFIKNVIVLLPAG